MSDLPLAGLRRRLASLLYECILLLALWFVAGFAVVGLFPAPPQGGGKLFLQGYLVLVAGLYFLHFWRRGGQTLAMKTWRLRLVDATGGPPASRRLMWRFAWALLGSLCLGAGFLWALFDRERQFLHDRLAGTRIVRADT